MKYINTCESLLFPKDWHTSSDLNVTSCDSHILHNLFRLNKVSHISFLYIFK